MRPPASVITAGVLWGRRAMAAAEATLAWAGPAAPGELDETRGWGAAEWAAARTASLAHGIAPLLAARLAGTPAWSRLDPALADYLVGQLQLNRLRIAGLLADLAEIRAAAQAAGLRLIPLKGAALVLEHYPDPALRPMADLDLLAHPDDEPALSALLVERGYRLVESGPRHRAFLRGDGRVASYDGEHPDNPRGVEIHTEVGERLRGIGLDITAALWAGGPAGLLLHLLIHTSHSLFNCRLRLIQLYDIALVAPRLADRDWAAIVGLASGRGEGRLLYAALWTAERAFGPVAPPALMADLAAATPAALRERLAACSAVELSRLGGASVSLGHRLSWYRPGRERLAALAQAALPGPTELRQLYPGLSGPLALAYGRHLAHLGGWARRRLVAGGRRLIAYRSVDK